VNGFAKGMRTIQVDFPNISDWSSGVKASHDTGDGIVGLGAQRHCDLAPVGGSAGSPAPCSTGICARASELLADLQLAAQQQPTA
jgi:hypothetical protein